MKRARRRPPAERRIEVLRVERSDNRLTLYEWEGSRRIRVVVKLEPWLAVVLARECRRYLTKRRDEAISDVLEAGGEIK